MSLKKYIAKKNPERFVRIRKGFLRFCIQKHMARHVHFDFRLEYCGILLSWVVPKGPSMNPRHKRLAIKVEDHPIECQFFEGIIPKGNYGAGKVKIWDYGIYTSSNATTSKELEKIIRQGLRQGHFTIITKGKKIQGEFVLQKIQTEKDSTWLLLKKSDK